MDWESNPNLQHEIHVYVHVYKKNMQWKATVILPQELTDACRKIFCRNWFRLYMYMGVPLACRGWPKLHVYICPYFSIKLT